MRVVATSWCCLFLLLCGCAGYRLGPTTNFAPGERSIQVNPFENKTLEPGLTDAIATQLRKEIQRDGTYRLATQGEGDVVVSGTIQEYRRRELTFSPRDTLTVTDFRLTLTAHIVARERGSGKILLDQPISGHKLVRVGPDLASTERQALPILAQDLAKNVASLLVEGPW